MTKTCSKCREDKELTEFSNGSGTYCKPCFRTWRQLNRAKHKSDPNWKNRDKPQSKQSRLIRRQWLINYLEDKACKTCGESDPVVLEFNHINPKDKFKGVGELVHQGTLDQLMTEVDKCEILCANCHKRVTAKQLNWHWVN